MSFDCGKVILIALLLAGCGESVSERSANQKRDRDIKASERYNDRQQQSTEQALLQQYSEQRLRSLEDRVTTLEKRP